MVHVAFYHFGPFYMWEDVIGRELGWLLAQSLDSFDYGQSKSGLIALL